MEGRLGMRLLLVIGAYLLGASGVPVTLRRNSIPTSFVERKPIHVERASEATSTTAPALPPAQVKNTADGEEPKKNGKGVRDHVEDIKRSARDTFGRIEKVDIRHQLDSDLGLLIDIFLPGIRFRLDIFIATTVVITTFILWLFIYQKSCYENDRPEDLLRWGITDGFDDTTAGPESGKADALRPDLVIVFHHPGYNEDSSEHHQATHHMLSRTLVAEVANWNVVTADGEVPVRLAPNISAPQVGLKREGDIIRGDATDGWVALADEDGFISVLLEEDPDEAEPHEGYPAPSFEMRQQQRKPALKPKSHQAHAGRTFHKFGGLMKDAMRWETAMTPMKHLRRARSLLEHNVSDPEGGEHRHQEFVPEMPKNRAARIALLQDLYEVLPSWGFDLAVFSSIDDDELYVCISLLSEKAQSSYLLRQGSSLQIRQDVVSRLGISQPPEEYTSSPPRVRFDPRIVANLHSAGVLPTGDAREFYESFTGRDKQGCIVSGKDRFRMIFKELCHQLDLDAAKYDGFIKDWYPCHSNLWLRKLEITWASFWNLFDFTFVQPVSMINDYFGSRVAFTFAWNGLHCKMLVGLSIFAILLELVGWAFSEHISRRTVNRRIVLAFSVCIAIWARSTYNMWMREEEYFMKLWDLNPEGQEQTVRPSFQGESQPSPADFNLLVKQYPERKVRYRQMLSALVTILFCTFVAFVMVIWYNIFEDDMNVVASIVLAITIMVFSAVYNVMVPLLTDWENHQFQSSYYNSFLWKQFLFHSVNRYFAFFQLAVKQRYTATGCPKEGCLAVIRMQLITTLAILSLTRIFEVLLASLVVKFKIWLEDFFLRRSRGPGASDSRSFIELQSKFGEARLQEQIQNMLQLVLSLGFILLFGAVAPIIVPFCLAVFMVQLRATALLLLKYTKRTLPRQQFGIGLWRWIVSVLMQASILFSGFLVAVYGDTFEGMPVITKVAGVAIYVMLMQVVCFMVDVLVPKNTPKVVTLVERRRRVQNVIMKRTEKYSGVSEGSPGASKGEVNAHLAREVAAGDWSKIPHLNQAQYAKESAKSAV